VLQRSLVGVALRTLTQTSALPTDGIASEGALALAPAHRSGGTLAERIQQRDRDRFVGREQELAFLEHCLGEDPPARLVLLHGSAGIGKSALLREFGRRAQARGWQTFVLQGGEPPFTGHAIEGALWPARNSARPLVLVDSYERIRRLGGELRSFLQTLPESAIVIVATRCAPEVGWFSGGWEYVARELELGPFTVGEASSLLRARGIATHQIAAIVSWANGSPLALAAAAEEAAAGSVCRQEFAESPELMRALLRQLVGCEQREVDRTALAVAALAPVATLELLRAVAASDCEQAYDDLCALSFAELVAGGVALQELARRALAADLRARDPEFERALRARIDACRAGALAAQPLAGAGPSAQCTITTSPATAAVDRGAVREALRNFDLVCELARSPLAAGADVRERAESVRGILRDAAERAFGDTANEQLLRRVVTCGYFEPGPSQEQRAYELNLSRSAYFRRLRVAVDRIADYVAANPRSVLA
jgi:hypothetical protein